MKLNAAPAVVALAIASLAPTLSHAQSTPSDVPDVAFTAPAFRVSPMIGAFLTGGGEKLATLEYTDGSSQDVTTGGLLDLHAGLELRPRGPFAVQGTVGYHVSIAGARNGDVTFSRVPIELIGLFEFAPHWRFGLGARYDTNVKLSSSGAASGVGAQEFDNAFGGVAEVEWMVTRRMGIVLRYVNESYRYSYTYVNSDNDQITVGHARVDGSHGGLGLDFHF
jgi:hypothetical protein